MSEVRLTLNDGTIIDGGRAGLSGGELMLWFPGYSILKAAEMVDNKNRMRKVVAYAGGFEDVYVGYTTCTLVTIDYSGETAICMRKE